MSFEFFREITSRAYAAFLRGNLKRLPRAPNVTGELVIDTSTKKVTFARVDITGTGKRKEKLAKDLVETSGLTPNSKLNTHGLIHRVCEKRQSATAFVRFAEISEPCFLEMNPLTIARREAAFPGAMFDNTDLVVRLRIWHLGGLSGMLVSPTPNARYRLRCLRIALLQALVAICVYYGARSCGYEIGESMGIASAAAMPLLWFLPRNPPGPRKPLSRFLKDADFWKPVDDQGAGISQGALVA